MDCFGCDATPSEIKRQWTRVVWNDARKSNERVQSWIDDSGRHHAHGLPSAIYDEDDNF